MKKLTLYIMSALLVAAPAFARIGETEAQVDARYGSVEHIDTAKFLLLTKLYRVKDLRVSAVFIDGTSECEMFSRPNRGKLTDQEVDILLKANAVEGEKPWTLKFGLGSKKIWVISDDRCGGAIDCVLRFATFDISDGQLMITSRKFIDREKKLAAEDAKKKLKDF